MSKANLYIKHPWLKCGLIWVCDVCGKPLLKNQKLGKKASNDALCHDKCLYYKKYGIKKFRRKLKKQKENATL